MPETFRLVVMNGVLHFPHGGSDFDVAFDRLERVPSLLIAQQPKGGHASIPFPLRIAGDAENLIHALQAERECNKFFPDDAIIELPDGTVFDFDVLLHAEPSQSDDTGADQCLLDHLAKHPLDPGLRLDPNSADPVIVEMFRLSTLIDADQTLTSKRRRDLNLRLLIELNAYEAWQRQYASYFRDLSRWTPPAAPMPSGRLPFSDDFMSLQPELRPSIHIFADFGGFTHRTKFPPVDVLPMQRRPSLVPEEICDCMTEWTNEFNRFGWEESRGKFGNMLWVAFDMRGLSIARAVKRYVGDAARVVYSKPNEDPFFLYESYREIQSTLAISVQKLCPA
jgi:hypothetical protein